MILAVAIESTLTIPDELSMRCDALRVSVPTATEIDCDNICGRL